MASRTGTEFKLQESLSSCFSAGATKPHDNLLDEFYKLQLQGIATFPSCFANGAFRLNKSANSFFIKRSFVDLRFMEYTNMAD